MFGRKNDLETFWNSLSEKAQQNIEAKEKERLAQIERQNMANELARKEERAFLDKYAAKMQKKATEEAEKEVAEHLLEESKKAAEKAAKEHGILTAEEKERREALRNFANNILSELK